MYQNGQAVTVLRGNLVAEPEMQFLEKSGKARTRLRLAINKKWKDSEGNLQETVSFIPVTVFGKQAEACAEYLVKGQEVSVTGELRQDRWEDDDGNKKSFIYVVGQTVDFGDKPKGSGGEDSGTDDDDEDVPF